MANLIDWIKIFKGQPGYNDAAKYGVTIQPATGPVAWHCIGVHHLTGAENKGNHHIFIDCLDEQDNVLRGLPRILVQASPQSPVVAVVLDKGFMEPGTNVPVWASDTILCRVESGDGSDIISGLHTRHADEEPGNTWGHHSYYVVFRRVGVIVEPPPEPEPVDCQKYVDTLVKISHSMAIIEAEIGRVKELLSQ